jgi:hypothetical protein
MLVVESLQAFQGEVVFSLAQPTQHLQAELHLPSRSPLSLEVEEPVYLVAFREGCEL